MVSPPTRIRNVNLSFKNIAPFLATGQNKMSKWFGYIGLSIGVLLLLCSIQMYININSLLKNKSPKKDGFDYLPITKTITDENMPNSHAFTDADIAEIKKQPFIDDAAPFISNGFVVKANGGATLPFSSDVFFEAINEKFIDTIPPTFTWKEGDNIVPIIISSDYLELYNTAFAPGRDLPQFSEKSITALIIRLDCEGVTGTESFRGNIVATSDRINTFIVPESFLKWGNKHFVNSNGPAPNKVLIRTKDANDPELLKFLQEKNYRINKDKTLFGRVKQVLQAIVSGLAAFGVLMILLALVLFSFYLQLMIARSKENLQLLLMIGYSPSWLSKTVSKKWIPVYTIIILIALAITAVLQYLFQHNVLSGRDELSPYLHISVVIVAAVLWLLCIVVNYRLIRKLLYRL